MSLDTSDYVIALNGRAPGTMTVKNDVFVFDWQGKTCSHALPKHPQPAAFESVLVYQGQKIFVMGGKNGIKASSKYCILKRDQNLQNKVDKCHLHSRKMSCFGLVGLPPSLGSSRPYE